MTEARLAELRAKAKRAVPGPYRVQGHGEEGSYLYLNAFPCDAWARVTGSERKTMAEYFAVLDPETMLALIAAAEENARLRDLPEWIVRKLKTMEYYEAPTDDRDMKSEIQGWMHVLCHNYDMHRRELKEYTKNRKARTELEAENARLRAEVDRLTTLLTAWKPMEPDDPTVAESQALIAEAIGQPFGAVEDMRFQSVLAVGQRYKAEADRLREACGLLSGWDQLKDKVADLERQLAERQWRTMESAPKDGTTILGWDGRMMRGKGMPRIILWAENLTTNQMAWMGIELAVEIPTAHWMPLPDAPRGTEPDTAKGG